MSYCLLRDSGEDGIEFAGNVIERHISIRCECGRLRAICKDGCAVAMSVRLKRSAASISNLMLATAMIMAKSLRNTSISMLHAIAMPRCLALTLALAFRDRVHFVILDRGIQRCNQLGEELLA